MSTKARFIDRIGGDRRAIFFIMAAGVAALMIPLTPTDPAKKNDVGEIIKPAYSFTYVPVLIICWCLVLALLSWLDNRLRLNQPTPIPPAVERGNSGVNGLAIASVALGVPALAGFGLWGFGVWGVASILALVYGESARRETAASGQKGRALAIVGIVLGVIGTVLVAYAIARWLGHSLSTAIDKLRKGEL
jgi:amino acid transporter